jgi:acetylglutamate kinase
VVVGEVAAQVRNRLSEHGADATGIDLRASGVVIAEPAPLITTSIACVPSWQLRQASETEPTGASVESKVGVARVE